MAEAKNLGWERLKNFIAGSVSGFALVAAGHPFDTIKVRMQSQGASTATHPRFSGPLDCLKQSIRREGFRSLYKGALAPFLLTGGINSILFGLQGICVSEIVAKDPNNVTLGETMRAAVLSGAMISVIVAPMEGVKARLQVQYNQVGVPAKYKGPFDCARQLIATEGLRKGLYRGWLPTCLSRASNYSYFGGYYLMMQLLGAGEQVKDENGKKKLSPLASIVAGGGAGIFYWLSCFPIDVVKNRMMTDPTVGGMTDTIRTIYARDGYRGFFRGFTPCLMRAFPANASVFLAFATTMHILNAF